MSDGAISQAEIDALLSGVDSVDLGGGGGVAPVSSSNLDLSFLKDFSANNAKTLSSSLETMIGQPITVGEPTIETKNRDSVLSLFPDMAVSVSSDFNEGLFGEHIVVMGEDFTQKLYGMTNGQESPAIDEAALSFASEIVNQHIGSEITSLSATGKVPGLACVPAESQHVPKAMVKLPQENFVLLSYPVTLGENNYTFWEVMSEEVAKGCIMALGGGNGAPASPDAMAAGAVSDDGSSNIGLGAGIGGLNLGGGMTLDGAMAGGAPNAGMAGGMTNMGMGMNIPNVQSVTYPTLQQGFGSTEQGNIGLIMDVLMEMTVELGRTKKEVKEILGMGRNDHRA